MKELNTTLPSLDEVTEPSQPLTFAQLRAQSTSRRKAPTVTSRVSRSLVSAANTTTEVLYVIENTMQFLNSELVAMREESIKENAIKLSENNPDPSMTYEFYVDYLRRGGRDY